MEPGVRKPGVQSVWADWRCRLKLPGPLKNNNNTHTHQRLRFSKCFTWCEPWLHTNISQKPYNQSHGGSQTFVVHVSTLRRQNILWADETKTESLGRENMSQHIDIKASSPLWNVAPGHRSQAAGAGQIGRHRQKKEFPSLSRHLEGKPSPAEQNRRTPPRYRSV